MSTTPSIRTGLRDGNSWSSMSRWEMAWRTAATSALVSMTGVLLLTLWKLLSPTAPPLVGGWVSALIGLGLPALHGLLAMLLGAWLRRFRVIPQGLLFGTIATILVFVALGIWAAVDSVVHPCLPGTGCWGSGFFFVITLAYYFFPILLLSVLGYLATILAPSGPAMRRGFSVAFWIVLAVFLVVVTTDLIAS